MSRSGAAQCACPVCDATLAPVCATDHNTYGSECKMRMHACQEGIKEENYAYCTLGHAVSITVILIPLRLLILDASCPVWVVIVALIFISYWEYSCETGTRRKSPIKNNFAMHTTQFFNCLVNETN